ncbi:MAG: fimbrillin family protein [Bacteroidales bacterium]|nr:fimbrillin family protein [Bacteroidales bacterium]
MKSTTSLSTIHDDFGVWGIARQEGNNTPYVLWDNDLLSQVIKSSSTDDETYIPVSNAYWLSGYKYNFIAIAPYNDSALTLTDITSSTPYSISFSYDMGQKYGVSNYVFDLLGAAAATETISGGRAESQNLTFWHLFTKLSINVEFVGATGTLDALRLYNVDSKAAYTVSFDSKNAYKADCTSNSSEFQKDISFTGQPAGNVLHIIPQDISDFRLFLDFTITQQDGHRVSTTNFEANISTALSAPQYKANEWYKWDIKISPKGIAFDVMLKPWVDAEGDDEDFTFDLE